MIYLFVYAYSVPRPFVFVQITMMMILYPHTHIHTRQTKHMLVKITSGKFTPSFALHKHTYPGQTLPRRRDNSLSLFIACHGCCVCRKMCTLSLRGRNVLNFQDSGDAKFASGVLRLQPWYFIAFQNCTERNLKKSLRLKSCWTFSIV